MAADVAGQGQWASGIRENVTFGCDGQARFDAGAQGQGHLVIYIKDAAGSTKASLNLKGQGQEGLDREITGEPGEWRLVVEVKDYDWGMGGQSYGGYDPYQGIDFQGQYAAAVLCTPPTE